MVFPNIDPVIFSVGPLHVRWYGLMYVLGFTASYLLVQAQLKRFSFPELQKHFENLNLFLILSVIVGGRLGYVLFYNFSYYLAHPLEIPATWSGGMSFHGACLAVFLTGWAFCRKNGIDFWKSADLYAVTLPIGLGLGRIGNFINGELFGRVTDVPWGMVFPGGGPLPRHPSQLYEAMLEGVCLFFLLWAVHRRPWLSKKYWPHGSIIALFFIGYGIVRIIVENFRQPDAQLGFVGGIFTMGQLLSLVMVIGGAILWLYRLRQQ
jgi:phosphatidylglycerol:prolipoprotein diacylglycerol transferase